MGLGLWWKVIVVNELRLVFSEIEEPGLIMGSVQSTVKTESVYDYTSSPGGSSGSNMDILKPMAGELINISLQTL